MTELTTEQADALAAIRNWHLSYVASSSQAFLLTGAAGTGKTTLARHVAELGKVGFAAFTGKAAHVLQSKGCDGATTIHRLIYHAQERSTARLQDLAEQVEAAWQAVGEIGPQDGGREEATKRANELERELDEERARCQQPGFRLNPESSIKSLDLLVVDEVSMVGKRVGRDLESFGVPILVLGDKAQLPPVMDGGYFTDREPDFHLREVHRHAKDSPVLDLATQVRRGEHLEYGTYGDSRVIRPGEMSLATALVDWHQIIVGRNKTRHALNAKARRLAFGLDVPNHPVQGDKVICTRNDHEEGFLNGSIWTVAVSTPDEPDDEIALTLVSEDGQRTVRTVAHLGPFRGEDVPMWKAREAQHFQYGYAITCHKAQGSQWDRVAVVDESATFGRDRHRWLYTAITRAADAVAVIR